MVEEVPVRYLIITCQYNRAYKRETASLRNGRPVVVRYEISTFSFFITRNKCPLAFRSDSEETSVFGQVKKGKNFLER